jgi:phi13 family phage major tail protein
MGIIKGLRDVHFAVLTKDDATGVTYSAPLEMGAGINLSISPQTSSATMYGNDQAIATESSISAIEVEVEIDQLTSDVMNQLLGIQKTADGVLKFNANTTAPYVALGFRAPLSGGVNNFRHVWLLKGQFALNEDSFATKGDQVEFQSRTISATFIPRIFDAEYRFQVDTSDLPVGKESIATDWFTAVYDPTIVTP